MSTLSGGNEIAAEALNKVLQLDCCKFLFWRFVCGGKCFVEFFLYINFLFTLHLAFLWLVSQVRLILLCGQRAKKQPSLVLEEIYQAIGPAMAVSKICRLVK